MPTLTIRYIWLTKLASAGCVFFAYETGNCHVVTNSLLDLIYIALCKLNSFDILVILIFHSWFKWCTCKNSQIYFRYSVYFCTCDWFIKLQPVQKHKTFFSNISMLLYLMLWPCDIFSTVCLDCFQCFQIHALHIDLKIAQRFILIQMQILSY